MMRESKHDVGEIRFVLYGASFCSF